MPGKNGTYFVPAWSAMPRDFFFWWIEPWTWRVGMLRGAVKPLVRQFARSHFTLRLPAYMHVREKYGDWSRNQLLRRIAQLLSLIHI